MVFLEYLYPLRILDSYQMSKSTISVILLSMIKMILLMKIYNAYGAYQIPEQTLLPLITAAYGFDAEYALGK